VATLYTPTDNSYEERARMIGDKLIIKEEHVRAAGNVVKVLLPRIKSARKKYVITVAGESGAGKSEIAAVLAESLSNEGISSYVIQQDDYFVYPPKTNAGMRRKNISHVGTSEVRLALIDKNLEDFRNEINEITKPLVIFDEDRITEETIRLDEIDAVIVEGTYVTILENVDTRIFIDRTCHDTKDARANRAREKQDEFLEEILEIEHKIISAHRRLAHIIVTRDYHVKEIDGQGQ
jgi:uridine kinase